jgi:ribosomal protein L28
MRAATPLGQTRQSSGLQRSRGDEKTKRAFEPWRRCID